MQDPADMLTAIEQAALQRLTDKIPALKNGVIQKGNQQQLRDIAVAVAVLDGKFNKIGQSTWRNECTVSVLFKFKNMQSEEARRKGINPLVQASVQYLLGQRLGLAIGPLVPLAFNDVTSEDDLTAGTIKYLLTFSTWFDLRQLDEEDLGDLVTIAIDYLLTPGDETVDASDTVITKV